MGNKKRGSTPLFNYIPNRALHQALRQATSIVRSQGFFIYAELFEALYFSYKRDKIN